MPRNPTFTVDAVAWHTQVQGNTESLESILTRFNALVEFLRAHELLSYEIPAVDERFELNSADLTGEGLALMKSAYDKWLKRIDRGGSPSDVALMAKALQQLRGGEREL